MHTSTIPEPFLRGNNFSVSVSLKYMDNNNKILLQEKWGFFKFLKRSVLGTRRTGIHLLREEQKIA